MTTRFIPDLMKSPTELTCIFEQAKAFERLVQDLSGTDHAGRRRSTAMLSMVRKTKFQADNYACHGAKCRKQNGGREDTMMAWKRAVMAMPEKLSVAGVQLELNAHERKNEEVAELVEMINKVLSEKSERPVWRVVVDVGNEHSG